MIEKSLRRTVTTSAMLVLLCLSGVLGALAAETTVYRDILKPDGHARDMTAKRADFAACGHPVSVNQHDFPKFRACMRARGWVIDRTVPDASARIDRGGGNYSYFDTLRPGGHSRSNEVEHAAVASCDGGDPRKIGTSAFNACMRGRGWRFAHFTPAPPSSTPSNDGGVPDWAWTCPFANC